LPKPEIRVAVLVSGNGTNLESILEAQKSGKLPGIKVVLVLSTKREAYALVRAKNYGVETVVVERKEYPSEDACQADVLAHLERARVDVICLAGYMRMVSKAIVDRFRARILNIHPALLPKYGGPGMYGHFVHEAVIEAGEKESGCTIHIVDEVYDHGPILAQAKVPVLPGDSPETLSARILVQEHRLYPAVLKEFCKTI
jgi:phosphoribosylglycinamide formyltransferase-1